jgi:hypothetical protein
MILHTTNLLLSTLTVDTSAPMLETLYLRGLTMYHGKSYQKMQIKVCGAEIVNVLPTKRLILQQLAATTLVINFTEITT